MFDTILALAFFLNPILGANGQLDRFTDTLLGFLPIVFFVAVLYFFLRRATVTTVRRQNR